MNLAQPNASTPVIVKRGHEEREGDTKGTKEFIKRKTNN